MLRTGRPRGWAGRCSGSICSGNKSLQTRRIAGIDVLVDDEIDAALFGIALLGLVAEVLDDFGQRQAVVGDIIEAYGIELAIEVFWR